MREEIPTTEEGGNLQLSVVAIVAQKTNVDRTMVLIRQRKLNTRLWTQGEQVAAPSDDSSQSGNSDNESTLSLRR